MKEMIDLTPTWTGIMPALIAALQNGSPVGENMAREELMRLAGIVDKQNEQNRAAKESTPAG